MESVSLPAPPIVFPSDNFGPGTAVLNFVEQCPYAFEHAQRNPTFRLSSHSHTAVHSGEESVFPVSCAITNTAPKREENPCFCHIPSQLTRMSSI